MNIEIKYILCMFMRYKGSTISATEFFMIMMILEGELVVPEGFSDLSSQDKSTLMMRIVSNYEQVTIKDLNSLYEKTYN